MKKKYFLFGSTVCYAMNEEGIEAALEATKSDGYEIYEWNENSTPNSLLYAFAGWDAYEEITEAEYIRFQNQ